MKKRGRLSDFIFILCVTLTALLRVILRRKDNCSYLHWREGFFLDFFIKWLGNYIIYL